MMWSMLILVIGGILHNGFQPADCWKTCSEKEEYVEHVNPCNFCEFLDGECLLPRKAGPGCDCISDFYRNERGVCIHISECQSRSISSAYTVESESTEDTEIYQVSSETDIETTNKVYRTSPVRPRPHSVVCRADEEFQECGCLRTCCNKGKNEGCAAQCTSGCFCKPPLVRNEVGGCVPLQDCKGSNSTGECGKNEAYNECGTACPKTCSNKNAAIKCISKCVKGCFCKEGYVRNDDGKCVKPNQCPADQCGVNEVYKDCGTACPQTCASRYIKIKCIDKCVEGCFCKDGYVRNDDGICVKPNQCPGETCGVGEEYTDCGSACPLTCDNIKNPPICTLQCVSGCFCQPGLVRNAEGRCVEQNECPVGQCGKNEVFKDCGTACPKTCANRNVEISCIDKCVVGCFCKDGYVRNDDGKCVKPEQCPPETCGVGEEYHECGTACPPTCDNIDKPPPCAAHCVRGCFCLPGLVRNDEGRCVDRKECISVITISPIKLCNKDEQFYECIPSCQRTCEALTRKPKIYCSQLCREGCFCKEGLYKRKDGKCVKPEQCGTTPPTTEPETCGKHEVFKTCGAPCPVTCSNRDKKSRKVCPRRCVRGCFCKDGYVKNADGQCVKPSECLNETCPKDEVYSTCVNPCNSCEIRGKCEFLVCNKGCDCKKGYHRGANGKCIPASQCPNKPTIPPKCGKDEQFYQCIPTCSQTCEAYADKERLACKTVCRSGCFCKKGLYKRKDGKCVKPSQCETPTTQPSVCGRNEEYSDCGTACPVTCSNRYSDVVCTEPCVKGCFCKKGYIRNYGICIKPSECSGETCGKGEEYNNCGSACPLTCDNKDDPPFCTLQCVPGCFCQPGLVRNDKGRCVEPSECPADVCGVNEVYKDCGTACPKTCANRNIKISCIDECVKGCFCKDGYVRNDAGKCVKPNQCPPDTCEIGEEYTDCGTACPLTCGNINNPPICTLQCVPGCFCQPGLVRNDEGRCVEQNKCPKDTCPKNEKYSDCVNPCNDCETKGKCEFLVCNKGCDCKKGYYRDINGKCIPESQCPVAPTLPPSEECRKDEQFYECMPGCQNTCFAHTSEFPIACKQPCRPGCFCKEGLYQTDDGKCVPLHKCPRPTKQPDLCGINEIYEECGTACPEKCSDNGQPQPCTKQCVSGCFCKNGFVRNDWGQCIHRKKCPTEVCGINEIYQECGNACPETCDNRGQPRICTKECVKGCFCNEGYVRNNVGVCVKPDECPTEQCGYNEAVVDCAKPKFCNTCEIRGNCKLKKCDRGCDCLEGYYRNETGICIPASQCPSETCPYNEEYSDCVIPCNDCYTRGDCEFLVCNKGCDCKKGFYRDTNGKCIPESLCPPTQTCGVGEEYNECGTACPPTCDNMDKPPPCAAHCVPGCFCQPGLVRNDKEKCVKKSECPTGRETRGVEHRTTFNYFITLVTVFT